MKKYLLAAALVMASTSALADRVVSGSTHGYGKNWDENKAEACQSAKQDAAKQARSDEEVEGYTRCECDGQEGQWTCTVDAKLTKK